jgi:SAM-dependent methyltransferase
LNPTLKINVGCGRNVLGGWINLDRVAGEGVNVAADLDACRTTPLPFNNNSCDEFLLSHVIEHIRDPLALMQELHRIATPNATATIRVPYGTADDAWEDPTHVRPYFLGSFAYFGQPVYWRADYGYRGDWKVEALHLFVEPDCAGQTPDEILKRVRRERNIVREMVAVLSAVKPIRPPTPEDRPSVPIGIKVLDT